MKGFTLILQDATRGERIEGVTRFVGEDGSGGFGLLPGHARFMTTLRLGLARFRIGAGQWSYLALPGAVLYFHDNLLTLSTRRYFLDQDYSRISQALHQQLLMEEARLRQMRQSLQRMEEEILRRLWEIGRRGPGGAG